MTTEDTAAEPAGRSETPAESPASGAGTDALRTPLVVALGASAGGLEAFDLFFRNVPVDSGMGFVLIQHLDPTHASMLSEILQRITALPVVEAQDGMAVEPNRVHVIPPNRDMVIAEGRLMLHLLTIT